MLQRAQQLICCFLIFLSALCVPGKINAQATVNDTLNNDFRALISGFPATYQPIMGKRVPDSSGEEKYLCTMPLTGSSSVFVVADRHWGGLNRLYIDLGTFLSKEDATVKFTEWGDTLERIDFLKCFLQPVTIKGKADKAVLLRKRWMFDKNNKMLSSMFYSFTAQLEITEKAGKFDLLLIMGLPEEN